MLVQRCCHRALNLLDVGLVHRHGRPPWGVVTLPSFSSRDLRPRIHNGRQSHATLTAVNFC
jgi:hypothetical protein